MALTLSIDPGLVGCGCALLEGSELVAGFFVKNPTPTENANREEAKLVTGLVDAVWEAVLRVAEGREITSAVLERPRVYVTHAAPPDDLMMVGLVVGGLAHVLVREGIPEVTMIVPSRWKRQVPKEIMLSRIEERLSDAERSRIKERRSTFRHNVVDAVGLGKWYARTAGT